MEERRARSQLLPTVMEVLLFCLPTLTLQCGAVSSGPTRIAQLGFPWPLWRPGTRASQKETCLQRDPLNAAHSFLGPTSPHPRCSNDPVGSMLSPQLWREDNKAQSLSSAVFGGSQYHINLSASQEVPGGSCVSAGSPSQEHV